MADEVFGRYRIGALLGRGGMGEVHRAFDTEQQREVALKRLSVALADEEDRARFRRESKTAASLRERHVVQVYDYGAVDGQLFLAMQLVDGTDLRRILQDGPLAPARAVELLTQIAAALDAAHAAGVVHRDVKPSNILLDGAGVAYLADFGIAKLMSPEATALTHTGGEIGTLDYMAPERLMRRGADARSDVYSLACVLFQCLTGKLPFPADDTAGKLAAQLNDPPPSPSLFDPRIQPGLDLVVATGMDKDPARRYPTAGELMAAAAAATISETQPPGASPTTPEVSGDPSQRGIMRAIVSVAARPARAGAATQAEECPYPGLRSFGPSEAAAFYGREHAVTDVLVRLSRQTPESGPLLVVGASGAGKSSLLHAGVLPALNAGSEGAWPQVTLSPGPTPLTTLAARLAPIAKTDASQLVRQLHARPSELGKLCRQIARQRAGEHGRLVIVVDQLEELFTTGDGSEQEAFAMAIAHAWPAVVVLAVRADFIAQCIRLEPLRPALAHPYVVGPLGVADLHRVIVEPARSAGLAVEQGLPERLVTDLGASGRSGYDPGTLPRLAHALRETWRHREGGTLTLKAYQATGGIERAVALTADGVYQRLTEQERPHLRAALLRMVTVLDGGGLARRTAAHGELPEPVLARLVDARLVTADADGVRLSHDALLTAWPRLREWIDEDRHGLLVRQHLDQAAAAWQAAGRDQGELYRGARLAGALEWAGGRGDLTDGEQQFLRESRRVQRRGTRRLRLLVAGLAVFLVAALVAGVVAVFAAEEANQQADVAESGRLAAESLADADFDPVGARRKALQAWRTSQTPAARGALLSNATYDYPVRYSSGVKDALSVAVSPDGVLIAVGGRNGQLEVIDTRTGKPIVAELTGNKGEVSDVEFAPDGTMLAAGSLGEEGVRVWSMPSGKPLSALPTYFSPTLTWRPDGKMLAAYSHDHLDGGAIAEWDPRTGKRGRLLTKRQRGVYQHSIAFNDDGSRLAIGTDVGRVELWDPAKAKLIKRNPPHRSSVRGLLPNATVGFAGDVLVSMGYLDRTIRLADAETGKALGEISDPDRHAPGHRFAISGRNVLTTDALAGEAVVVWSVTTRGMAGNYPQGPEGTDVRGGSPEAVATSAAGGAVAVQLDGTVLRWPNNPGRFAEPGNTVNDVTVAPDGKRAAAVDDRHAYVWDPTTGVAEPAPVDAGAPFAVAYAAQGALFVGTSDGDVVMTPAKGRTRRFSGGWRGVERGEIAVSPDGKVLAVLVEEASTTGSLPDRQIHVWDTGSGQLRRKLDLEKAISGGLAFSPDGDELIVATNPVPENGQQSASANVIRRWRTADLAEQPSIKTGTLGSTAFTPDGKSLLVAADTEIEVLDPVTGKVRRTIGKHPSTIRSLAVAPDGKTVATATTAESVVRLWNIADDTLVARLTGHAVGVNDLEFAPDGTFLASAGLDTDVGVWPTSPDDAVERICADLRAAGERGLPRLGC